MTPHDFATARATRHHGQKPVRQTLSEYLRVLFVSSLSSTWAMASAIACCVATLHVVRKVRVAK